MAIVRKSDDNRGQTPKNHEQLVYRDLTPDASQIVVAYSGGLDSTVLLHMVKQSAPVLPLLAVHVNHNLSPNAVKWQTHCENVCKQWKIPFIAKSVHITSNDQGLEAQARKLRYEAISESIAQNAVVLTGQHQQDQLETFLLQLKRGAGPKGLSCMPRSIEFEKDAVLVRPLLDLTRQELEQYAIDNDLSWIEDESNQDTRFDRNFIRRDVLPTIQARWPGFGKAATRSIGLIAEQQQLVDEMAEQDLQPLQLSANSFDSSGLKKRSKARQRNLVRYWIASQKVTLPSMSVLDNMLSQVIDAKPDATPKVKWGDYQLRRYRDVVYLFDNSIEQPGVGCCLIVNQPVILNDNIGTLCLTDGLGDEHRNERGEEALLLRSPMENEIISVRFNVTGLSCKPQGSAHTRKLKDLFKQHNIPPWQRSRTPLIYYNEQLVAVAGMFVCEPFAASGIIGVRVKLNLGTL
ncbi:MAG: tRNA lysidine(34) synthetase TilS [Algicola sp.]|nr:tRNA lysidine(34) synthetase TilS [Algicola sp.]